MQLCPLKELYEPSPPCLFSAALQPCLFEECEGGGESLREDGFWRIQLPSFPSSFFLPFKGFLWGRAVWSACRRRVSTW